MEKITKNHEKSRKIPKNPKKFPKIAKKSRKIAKNFDTGTTGFRPSFMGLAQLSAPLPFELQHDHTQKLSPAPDSPLKISPET